MKIFVYDVPAFCGGALTVLKELFDFANNKNDVDWVFVMNPKVRNIFNCINNKNIKIIFADGAETSRLKRLQFDYTLLRKIIKHENPDILFSLANVTLPYSGIPQYVYMHNPVPFTENKYSFSESKELWIYQNIISKFICSSMKKCDKIVIQTKWVKESVIKKCGVTDSKFIFCPPNVNREKMLQYNDSPQSRKIFFFPSGFSTYKNHVTVIRAAKELINKGINDFEIVFTLNPDIKEIGGESLENLPVRLTGYMNYDDVLKMYSQSVLIFPSKLETFGLPLVEARFSGDIIIAGKTEFSCELLDRYENAVFFDVDNYKELAEKMSNVINGNFNYNDSPAHFELIGNWDSVISDMKRFLNQ